MSGKQHVEQHGGGVFIDAFKALLWTLLILILVVFLLSWLAIKFLRNAPIIGPLVGFGCAMSNQGWFDIILSLLDLLLLIPPLFPIAAAVMLANKAYKAFSVICLVTGLTPWTFSGALWSLLGVLPFGGIIKNAADLLL